MNNNLQETINFVVEFIKWIFICTDWFDMWLTVLEHFLEKHFRPPVLLVWFGAVLARFPFLAFLPSSYALNLFIWRLGQQTSHKIWFYNNGKMEIPRSLGSFAISLPKFCFLFVNQIIDLLQSPIHWRRVVVRVSSFWCLFNDYFCKKSTHSELFLSERQKVGLIKIRSFF